MDVSRALWTDCFCEQPPSRRGASSQPWLRTGVGGPQDESSPSTAGGPGQPDQRGAKRCPGPQGLKADQRPVVTEDLTRTLGPQFGTPNILANPDRFHGFPDASRITKTYHFTETETAPALTHHSNCGGGRAPK